MVRKFEARPIRAFLTTATRDMENAAGDWYLLNLEMDKALKFSGYDYQFRVIDGQHVAGYSEHWQEAMAYLWRGWPERVQAGSSAPPGRRPQASRPSLRNEGPTTTLVNNRRRTRPNRAPLAASLTVARVAKTFFDLSATRLLAARERIQYAANSPAKSFPRSKRRSAPRATGSPRCWNSYLARNPTWRLVSRPA